MLLKVINCVVAVLFINALLVVGCDDSPSDPTDNNNVEERVSFVEDILPIFTQHGCTSCHGGEAGLFVTTVEGLLEGGDNGPAIEPGDAENSLLIQKLSPDPPFGDRMPQGAPPVPESQQNTIKQWINEGAEDN
jgi:hypothetical protein